MTTTTPERISRLQQTWRRPRALFASLAAINHRAVGLRYIVTGMVFFALAGIAALLMRIQLAYPENNFLNAELYNQIFTMHGVTMMFIFAVPIMQGLAIYLVPMMIGARDVAFPRLNAFGYWAYLLAGTTLWLALFFGSAPDGGWFSYVPLTESRFSPGLNIDFWATMITFLEVSALVAAVQIIVTVFTLRAPGMTMNRIPLFVWAVLVMAFMVVFAMPTLMTGSLFLELDRKVATHFYNPAAGGDPLLWQHLFWFFGHPEVYIMLLPGLGIVATLVGTFSRRPVIGYIPLVISFVAIGVVSFGVWAHHMFLTGLAPLALSFISVASFLVAIPSGVQIFAALATFNMGRLWFQVPLLYVFGFIFIFVLGGITGVMVASISFDGQVHDTYFLVAHFHYVLVGGVVFPLLGGLYYWFPKMSGRMLDDVLGRWSFWLAFIGFNIAFFPMHITGFYGMPRRVYTYLAGLGWDGLNLTSTIGAFVLALGLLIFFLNVFKSLAAGQRATDNPWQAGSLEWATSSPPQDYAFRRPPAVNSLYPLWYQEVSDSDEQEALSLEESYGLLPDRRETIGTSLLDAVPQQRVVLPSPTIRPLLLALAVAVVFIGLPFDVLFVPIGLILVLAAIIYWHIPEPDGWDMEWVKDGRGEALPTNMIATSRDIRTPNWWGMFFLILIETVAIGALVASYYYLRSGSLEWPIGKIDPPELLIPTINAFILWAAIIPMHMSERSIKRGNLGATRFWLVLMGLMTLTFVGIKVYEYSSLSYNWATNAYASIVWTITGFHVAHVISVVLKTSAVTYYAFRGYFNEERFDGISTNAMYGYFVSGIWVPLYLTLYIAPYVLRGVEG